MHCSSPTDSFYSNTLSYNVEYILYQRRTDKQKILEH